MTGIQNRGRPSSIVIVDSRRVGANCSANLYLSIHYCIAAGGDIKHEERDRDDDGEAGSELYELNKRTEVRRRSCVHPVSTLILLIVHRM